MRKMFKPVSGETEFPKIEEATLRFWQENNTFEQSLQNRKGCPEYVFYDGPPFATGLPHYGHLLAGTIKDVIPRYQTMLGKYCRRTFGWDCHGLPVENEMEKQLAKEMDLEKFGKKEIVTFIIANIVANVLAWLVVAPVLDILIYAEPANKVFAQGATAAAINSIAAVVVVGDTAGADAEMIEVE